MNKLVLIGGGGHCISCIDIIEETGEYQIVGILDTPEHVGEKILEYEVVGTDNDIEKYQKQGCQFCITVGQVSSGETLRKKIFQQLEKLDVVLPVIISPAAMVSRHADLGKGTIVLSGARINAGVRIGSNCIINSQSLIEHGAFIGNHSHISTGAIINGDCSVFEKCFIGSGVILKHGITLANGCTIGMGAIVTKNITEPGIYAGIPARLMK